MKSNSLIVTTSQDRELVTITISNPFTCKNLAKLYSRIFPSFLEVNRTEQDAKFITQSILFIFLFGAFVFFVFPVLLAVLG